MFEEEKLKRKECMAINKYNMFFISPVLCLQHWKRNHCRRDSIPQIQQKPLPGGSRFWKPSRSAQLWAGKAEKASRALDLQPGSCSTFWTLLVSATLTLALSSLQGHAIRNKATNRCLEISQGENYHYMLIIQECTGQSWRIQHHIKESS